MTYYFEKDIIQMKKLFDKELEEWFGKEFEKAKNPDKDYKENLKILETFILRGGKRIRSSLMYWGYVACQGKDVKAIVNCALSMEFLHTCLLIQDDIMDDDLVRRGGPAVHKIYEEILSELPKKKSQKTGESLAVLASDISFSIAVKIILKSSFKENLKLEALKLFLKAFKNTVLGQIKDVKSDFEQNLAFDEILKIYQLKTAEYTFQTPLMIGAVLAQAPLNQKRVLAQYAKNIGIAFQIHDDLIGIYSDKNKIGKEMGADIKKGKKTLLLLKILEKASPKDKKFIENLFFKSRLSKAQLQNFKEIAEKTGALEYCENLKKSYYKKAVKAISNSSMNADSRNFFLNCADFMINRKQ
ncbi:MAG: hypothetical protein GF335_03405 [Candidatus Moranbacteria bacterium]|nr:hypothetical protein [Candidatus Moranbacteria bacterium]